MTCVGCVVPFIPSLAPPEAVVFSPGWGKSVVVYVGKLVGIALLVFLCFSPCPFAEQYVFFVWPEQKCRTQFFLSFFVQMIGEKHAPPPPPFPRAQKECFFFFRGQKEWSVFSLVLLS